MHPSRSSISTRSAHRLALAAPACSWPPAWALSASAPHGGGTSGADAMGGATEHRPDPGRRSDAGPVHPPGDAEHEAAARRHGTMFRNYIATTAQCCPSRASLITGQYAHNDGVTSNGVGYRGLVDKGNVLPVWLQQAGYLTMHVGKFMNGYQQFADPPSRCRQAGTSGTASSAGPGTTTTTCTSTATSSTAGRTASGQRHAGGDQQGGPADPRAGRPRRSRSTCSWTSPRRTSRRRRTPTATARTPRSRSAGTRAASSTPPFRGLPPSTSGTCATSHPS